MRLYAVVARTFPAHMRISGTGFVIGVGRIGSAIGPIMAGAMLTAGLSMAMPSVLAALLLLKFPLRPPNTP